MKTQIFFALLGLGCVVPAEAQIEPRASSTQAWVREYPELTPLFDYFETNEVVTQDGVQQIVSRMRFVERLTGADSYREVLRTDMSGTQLISYEVEQLQIDEKGSIVVDQTQKKIFYRYYKEKKWKEAEEKLDMPFLVGAMIPKYIQANEKFILEGGKLRFALAVPYMHKSFGFSLWKHDDKEFEGRKMVSVELAPTHFLVRAASKPLYFTYDPVARETRQIIGKIFLKKRVSSGWEPFKAETFFLKETQPTAASPGSEPLSPGPAN